MESHDIKNIIPKKETKIEKNLFSPLFKNFISYLIISCIIYYSQNLISDK